MFSGIIQNKMRVKDLRMSNSVGRLTLFRDDFSVDREDLGGSFMIDGICLTLADFCDDDVAFDVVDSTFEKSTISDFSSGKLVNVERSLRLGDENGGHCVSGHIDFTATVEEVKCIGDSRAIVLCVAGSACRYLFPQGSVAINGCSLTVDKVDQTGNCFSVWIIPETSERTNLGLVREGDVVNIEIERSTQVVVDSVYNAVHEALSQMNLSTNDASQVAQIVGSSLNKTIKN